MVLYASLVVCGVLAVWMVSRHDLYDREPWPMVVVAVGLGALAMWAAGRVQVWGMTELGAFAASHWNTVLSVMAGVTEELAKVSVVVVIALGAPRWFNDPMDGIVYGSFAGLGAALEESVAVLGWPHRVQVLPLAEVVRVMGHLVMGGIGGYAVGVWRVERGTARYAFLFGLGGAIALHVFWDITAFSASSAGRMMAWHKAAAVGLMFGGLMVYWVLVSFAAGLSRRRFGEGAARVCRGA